MIRIILIALVAVVFISAIKNRNTYGTKAWFKIAVLVFVVLAILSILFPDATTEFANRLGVGRGADLLLYFTALLTFWGLIENHLRSRQQDNKIAMLTRELTILKNKVSK